MSNQVVVTLSAKDEISKVVRGLKVNLGTLPSSVSGLSGAFGSIGNSLKSWAGDIGNATLQLGKLTAAGLAFSAIGIATNGIMDATKSESQSLAAANALSVSKSISLDAAQSITAAMEKVLSKDASVLPGSAKDYMQIMSAISPAVAGATASMDEYKNTMLTISKLSGAIKPDTVSGDMAGIAISKFISEGTDFRQNDFFQKNAGLKDTINKEMVKLGVDEKQLGKMTASQRAKLFETALKSYTTPELLTKLAKTSSGAMGALSDSFFSERDGIFGFLREFKDSATGASTNALEGFKGFISSLNNLFSALKARGGGIDPMVLINEFFQNLTAFVNRMTAVVKGGGDLVNFLKTELITGIRLFAAGLKAVLNDPEIAKMLREGLHEAIKVLVEVLGEAFKNIGGELWKAMGRVNDSSGINGAVTEMQKTRAANPSTQPANFQDILGGIGNIFARPTNVPQPSGLPSVGSSNMIDKRQPANVSFVINGADMDKKQLANEVLQKMSGMFQEYKRTVIA